MVDITEWKEAEAAGLKRYFTGKPCTHGHSADRYVADRRCVECVKQRGAKVYAINRERAKQRAKEWRAANPERARHLQAKSYAKNPEPTKQRAKKSRAKQKANNDPVQARTACEKTVGVASNGPH